jgi:hypothetical protein
MGLRFGRAKLIRWTLAIEFVRLGQLQCVIRIRSPRAYVIRWTLAIELQRL